MTKQEFSKAVSDRTLVSDVLDHLQKKASGHPTTPLDLVQTERVLTRIDNCELELMDCHRRIIQYNTGDIVPHQTEFERLLNLAMSVHSQVHGIKSSFPVAAAVVVPTPTAIPHSSDIRLPKLQIPTFSGNLLEWVAFKDIFTSAVIKNTHLAKSQKLAHLKSVLTDEALRLINSLVLSDANFDIAWTLLSDRYQNDRETLFAIMARLHGIKSAGTNSPATLRHLVDVTKESINSLAVLNIKRDKAMEAFLLFYLSSKLDNSSRELWEQSLKSSSIPPLQDLFEFLEQRARALAAGGATSKPISGHREEPRRVRTNHTQSSSKCSLCKENHHPIYRCSKFLDMEAAARVEFVRMHSLCDNCLNSGHSRNNCKSTRTCRTCNKKHNTLLHLPNEQLRSNHVIVGKLKRTLLATAVIRVKDAWGHHQLCRAFLDNGSENTLISKSCVRRLGLFQEAAHISVTGVSSTPVGTSEAVTSVTFQPHFKSSDRFEVTAVVMDEVTGDLPSYAVSKEEWPHIKNLLLADPHYTKVGTIDILLGSDIYWELVVDGLKKGPKGSPTATNTSLGWLVAGNISSAPKPTIRSHYTETNLDETLRRFWEIESVPSVRTHTVEEEKCQQHFAATHSRDETGRFHVQIPFKTSSSLSLGSSREGALRRLLQLERRLELPINKEHKSQYHQFMQEYQQLGHMTEVPAGEICNNKTYYIPHHFVLKEDSTTTKFRVVFDASAKTSNGLSLNDLMMVGPVLQDSLVEILMRFRIHQIAFTADIEKMYRQILVSPVDSDLQRILWRTKQSETIKEYRLLTVSYGTASAPYLATKTLQQLARDEESTLPLAAEVALNDFYVDDMMSGAENLDSAVHKQQQLLQLMTRGCLSLRKWASNSQELLQTLPQELVETKTTLDFNMEESVKALGVRWNTTSDVFQFHSSLSPQLHKCTRRTVLSETAKLFDPIGWLSPVVVIAKILSQSLWKLSIGWDDPLPEEITQEWINFRESLNKLVNIRIPRTYFTFSPQRLELAGFSDSSIKAYAAVIYILAFQDESSPAQVSLVTSKTRVAPVKTLSVPKLELCGAEILADLLTVVKKSLKLNFHSVRCYTDSTITLDWIKRCPSTLKVFVANRVTAIQAQLPSSQWFHVAGEENPADIASRGMDPSTLSNCSLWWNGPSWLTSASPVNNNYTLSAADEQEVMKEIKTTVRSAAVVIKEELTLLCDSSSLRKLLRVTCWILRFCNNCRRKTTSGPLSTSELQAATAFWIKRAQQQSFPKELSSLSSSGEVKNSKLSSLSPFLDSEGILRVGGRLRHAKHLSPDQRTPFLLPRHSRLTELIILQFHLGNSHAGPQLLLTLLQTQYWIVRGRDAVRFILRKCIKCQRMKAQTMKQYMGDLPSHRVSPSRAFLRVGVDYAGPFLLRSISPRSKTTLKSWMCIFVCFSTRAVHLELVSSLSTDAFLAAFRRFVSRRGRPTEVYSDNGTNFVGAAKELQDLSTLLNSSSHQATVTDTLSSQCIQWKFIPPGSPHFGGLWEAGVKSVKYHLHRVLSETRLTFEEMTTLLCQIEGCLNSRPLTALSTDPDDLAALTPGHFLIGGPLNALPDPDLTEQKMTRLDRWQLLQSLQQQFWKRWSCEFLTRLQQRPKWLKKENQPKLDDLVLIKDERLPPQKWKLARITELHPGSDGLPRVATLRTADGLIKRPIVKLSLLPLNASTDEPSDDII